MMFESVLFDLDDTLHDRNRSLYKFIGLFIKQFSSVMVFDDISKIMDIFFEIDCKGYKPRDEMFNELLSIISWRRKPEIQELMDFWKVEFPKCAEPMEDLFSMLDFFLDKKIKMGIVTNGDSHFQNTKIDKLNLRKYMDVIIISEDVGIRKPDPAIFHHALSKINTKAENTLFVGDNLLTDIKGALKAGLIPVWLNAGKTKCEKDFILKYSINSISELIYLF